MIQKQIRYVKHKDLGFDKEQLLQVNTPYYFKRNEVLKSELLKHSNIKSLSYSRGAPGKVFSTMGNGIDENYFDLKCISVDTTFLKTFDIELILGRNFMPSDFDKTCIINKEAFRKYCWEDLENKRFMNGREGGYEVIGVVDNFHIASLYKRIEPVCLIYDVKETSFVNMRLAGGDLSGTMDYIETTWEEVSDNLPFEYRFYDTLFDRMYKKEEALANNVSLFAFIALVLTILGIFGQIFHVSIVRTKEIGIRKVNGARITEILAMLNNDFIKWVCIAFIIATPITWYIIEKWLAGFSYRTTMDWWVFILGGLLVLLITIITVSLQSWRTATRNPVEALRYE
jgi:putative ABC transport system permease protein